MFSDQSKNRFFRTQKRRFIASGYHNTSRANPSKRKKFFLHYSATYSDVLANFLNSNFIVCRMIENNKTVYPVFIYPMNCFRIFEKSIRLKRLLEI